MLEAKVDDVSTQFLMHAFSIGSRALQTMKENDKESRFVLFIHPTLLMSSFLMKKDLCKSKHLLC